MQLSPFLIDLIIAVLVYFLFSIVIDTFIKEAKAHEIFKVILLIACVLFALFGSFLPFIK